MGWCATSTRSTPRNSPAWPLEEVTVNLDVRSSVPIRAVYSPSHTVDVSRESQTHVRAGYEDSQVLPGYRFRPVLLPGRTAGLPPAELPRLLVDADDPDGFFLLLLAPRPEVKPCSPCPRM